MLNSTDPAGGRRQPTRWHGPGGLATAVLWLLLGPTSAGAQDLDPRAYAQVKTGLTLVIAGATWHDRPYLIVNRASRVTTDLPSDISIVRRCAPRASVAIGSSRR